MRAIKALVDKIREGYPVAITPMGREAPVRCSAWKYLSRQKNPITHHSNGGRIIQLLDTSQLGQVPYPQTVFSRINAVR